MLYFSTHAACSQRSSRSSKQQLCHIVICVCLVFCDHCLASLVNYDICAPASNTAYLTIKAFPGDKIQISSYSTVIIIFVRQYATLLHIEKVCTVNNTCFLLHMLLILLFTCLLSAWLTLLVHNSASLYRDMYATDVANNCMADSKTPGFCANHKTRIYIGESMLWVQMPAVYHVTR